VVRIPCLIGCFHSLATVLRQAAFRTLKILTMPRTFLVV
jgi:hypothetical protein